MSRIVFRYYSFAIKLRPPAVTDHYGVFGLLVFGGLGTVGEIQYDIHFFGCCEKVISELMKWNSAHAVDCEITLFYRSICSLEILDLNRRIATVFSFEVSHTGIISPLSRHRI